MYTDEKQFLDYHGLKVYKERMQSYVDAGDSMRNDLTVELGENGSLGGYKTGDKISVNTPIEEVIKKLLAKQIPPTYTAPSVSITYDTDGFKSGSYEYGTNVSIKLKATYTQNDGGNLISIKIEKDGNEILEEDSFSPLRVSDGVFPLLEKVSYKAIASYGEGNIKKDNFGELVSEGHILPGEKSSSNFVLTPYRQGYFYGVLDTSSEEQELTSGIIRSGHMKDAAYASGTIGTKDKPLIKAEEVENRKRIFVACPANQKGLIKVTMPSALDADCTVFFEKMDNTIVVDGAEGSDGIAYNVWVYEPALITDDQTFVVTLG